MKTVKLLSVSVEEPALESGRPKRLDNQQFVSGRKKALCLAEPGRDPGSSAGELAGAVGAAAIDTQPGPEIHQRLAALMDID
jgi:hypothetical protein